MIPPAPRRLEPAQERRALRLSMGDGIAYALMVGAAESFFVANAIRLGASALEVGLVFALPLFLGSIGPVAIVRLLARAVPRRPIVVACALLQVLGLAAIALANLAGVLTPIALIGVLCVHQACGLAAGTAWSSWYGDVVPAAMRGRWFAMRTRAVQAATFIALVGGGIVLHLVEPSGAAAEGAAPECPGFAWVFGGAAFARLVSAVLLWLSPEPSFRGLASRARFGKFLRTQHGRTIGWLLLGGLVYQASVYVGAPFFTPFMLEDLRLDYAEFTGALGAVVAAKVVTLPAWGRYVDRAGPLKAFRIALVATALVPAPWLVIDGALGAWLAQAVSGVAWAGHEVAIFALLLDSTRSGNRPQVLAFQSVSNSIGQIGGSLCGAAVVGVHGHYGAIAASLIARTAVAGVTAAAMRAPRPVTPRPALSLRVAGYRPGAGVVHRPIVGSDAEVVDDPGGEVRRTGS